MTVELSFIHWDVLDEEDRSILPSEYKLDIVFLVGTIKHQTAWKGHIIAVELSSVFERKTREGVYPRDFLWKSSKSDRMHKWSYDMYVDWKSVFLVHYDVLQQLVGDS